MTEKIHHRTRWLNSAGLTGVLIIFAGMLAAGLAYTGTEGQSYRVANHFVSELGQTGVSHYAIVFNAGLIVGGACIVLFVIGLVRQLSGWFRYVLGAAGIVTGVFGALVGLFPMNNPGLHAAMANGFFYPGLVTMLLFSAYLVTGRQRALPRFMALPGFIAAAALFGFLFLGPALESVVNGQAAQPGFGPARPEIWVSALFEWVAIGAVLLWVAAVSAIISARSGGR